MLNILDKESILILPHFCGCWKYDFSKLVEKLVRNTLDNSHNFFDSNEHVSFWNIISHFFFRGKNKTKMDLILNWLDFFDFFNLSTIGICLVTLKIKYSFWLKQSEIYWKSQNFHNSYCILNPILNTIGTLVAKITQIANFFRKKPNFNKLSTMFQW